MSFIGNFVLFPVVKNFENQFRFDHLSYRHEFSGTIFGTRCKFELLNFQR